MMSRLSFSQARAVYLDCSGLKQREVVRPLAKRSSAYCCLNRRYRNSLAALTTGNTGAGSQPGELSLCVTVNQSSHAIGEQYINFPRFDDCSYFPDTKGRMH